MSSIQSKIEMMTVVKDKAGLDHDVPADETISDIWWSREFIMMRKMSPALIVYLVSVFTLVPYQEAVAATKSKIGARALIGNTMHGTDMGNGQEYWNYYNPNGTVISLENGDRETSTWFMKGQELCEHHSDGATECSTYEIDGNMGMETSVEGTAVGQQSPIQILRGNPKGL